MNSKSLQNSNAAISKLEKLAYQQASVLTTIVRIVSGFFIRSEIEKSQARYEAKRKHEVRAQLQQDIVSNLPLGEKHRLGLYHLMD